jgi:DNA-binding transcriptional LysR family regulator
MEMFDKGQLDLIVTLDVRQVRSKWKTLVRLPARIDIICAKNHPVAAKKPLTLKNLANERYIMGEKGCNYRAEFEKMMQEKGEFPECFLEIGHTRTILDAVAKGVGLTVLPEFVLKKEDYEKLQILCPEDYSLTMEIQVITRQNRWLSPAMIEFTKMWESAYQELSSL